MLTLLIALVVGLATGFSAYHFWGVVWGIVFGFIGVIAAQLLTGLVIRKKINRINGEIQEIMMDAQKQINRKVQMFQQKPHGDVKGMQKLLEKEQENHIREALKATDRLQPFCKWNLLLDRQIATMKMMYCYQLKEFNKVDELMPKVMFFDPRALAIKLARMYKKNADGIDKLFQRKARRCKGESATLLYALYSWILVKQQRIDDAIKVLVDGKSKTGSEVLASNWEHLVNGRIKQFSNAGLGDEWFALYLEEPKIKAQKARRQF